VLEALLWGAVASSSLLLGAAIGIAVRLPERVLGLLLGVGAGALIAGVSLELADEALREGGAAVLAVGLATGAMLFYGGDRLVDRLGQHRKMRPRGVEAATSGATLALGALLDGVPEQAALGIGLATGDGVGVALLAAIFLSNVPEAVGSAAAMRRTGRGAGRIVGLWALVAAGCIAATVIGRGVLGGAGGGVTGFILALAAGAVLVMLVDAMVPEAVREGGRPVGLCTVLGFAAAVLISAPG
jgi:zinc transporter, ZIP family